MIKYLLGQEARFRKKYFLTLAVWAMGSLLAFYVKSGLPEYTAFAVVVLGVFSAADVTDKKLNGRA